MAPCTIGIRANHRAGCGSRRASQASHATAARIAIAGKTGSAYVSSFDFARLRKIVPVRSKLQPRRVASPNRRSLSASAPRRTPPPYREGRVENPGQTAAEHDGRVVIPVGLAVALRLRREAEHVSLQEVVVEVAGMRRLHGEKPRRRQRDGRRERQDAAEHDDHAQAPFDREHREVGEPYDRHT